jgi:hypothetical protein
MILVLEINGGLLYLFQSAVEVESRLEAIDVENGEYEFCDSVGQRFVGEIISPITKFRAGSFRLKADGAPDKTVVTSLLSRARSLDKGIEGIKNLDDLRKRIG